MSGTNSSFSLYHLTVPAGWCAVIGAVPVRTLYELSGLYHKRGRMARKSGYLVIDIRCHFGCIMRLPVLPAQQ